MLSTVHCGKDYSADSGGLLLFLFLFHFHSHELRTGWCERMWKLHTRVQERSIKHWVASDTDCIRTWHLTVPFTCSVFLQSLVTKYTYYIVSADVYACSSQFKRVYIQNLCNLIVFFTHTAVNSMFSIEKVKLMLVGTHCMKCSRYNYVF